MENVKKVLKWVIFGTFSVFILLVVIPKQEVNIKNVSENIDTNSAEYKEQYALATGKLNKELEVEFEKERKVDLLKIAKAKRVSAAKLSKTLVSLDFDLTVKKYSVVLADFTIRNKSDGALTDIEVKCSHYSPTNVLLAKKEKVLYVKVGKNSVKSVNGFSMGVTHPQATKSHCEILSYMFEGLRVWY